MLTSSLPQSAATAAATPIREPEGPRYAIYYAPPRESAWWRFGCAWLGRDAITGTEVARPRIELFCTAEIELITREPRRYGFHATLKAPFRLATSHTARDVYLQAANLAATLKPAPLPPLQLTTIDDFVALSFTLEATGAGACHDIAAQCVTGFDYLRAQPTAAELARRAVPGLTTRQRELLSAWGYPYVFDAFRFHLTLTGPLLRGRRACVIDALTPLVGALQSDALNLNALCVYRQASPDAPFVITRRYAFDGRVETYRDD